MRHSKLSFGSHRASVIHIQIRPSLNPPVPVDSVHKNLNKKCIENDLPIEPVILFI